MSRTANGFYTHFIKNSNGSPCSPDQDGGSPIDTAIMVSGVLFAAEYFKNDDDGTFYQKSMDIASSVKWSDVIKP